MPIRSSQKAVYPERKEWQRIRDKVLARAGYACEQCQKPNHKMVPIAKDGVWFDYEFGWRDSTGAPHSAPSLEDERAHVHMVLTIAHRNHDPTDNGMENLAALCQRCHLVYDRELHVRNAADTRRSRKAMGDLFDAL